MDIKNSLEIIAKISTFSAVRSRMKEINQLIQEEGLVGIEFGRMAHMILQWLFDEYAIGEVHSSKEIKTFITEHRE